jgi:hypothetical protein
VQRRRFLSLAFGLTVLGPALGAGMAGCGGGGGDDGGDGGPAPVPLTETRAAVQTPAGFALPAGELAAETVWSGGAPAPDGTFAARVADPGVPTLAWLRHAPSGRPVLFGFVGTGQPGVGPLGTAAVLLGLSLGVTGLPAAQRRPAVEQIAAHPAAASLADAVARRVAANPFALAEDDAEIAAALKAAFDALTTPPPTRARKSVTGVATRAEGDDLPPLLLVQPSEDRSNARVVQTDGAGPAIRAFNLGRRPCAAYTYRTGQESESGAQSPTSQAAAPVGAPLDLPAVTSLLGRRSA